MAQLHPITARIASGLLPLALALLFSLIYSCTEEPKLTLVDYEVDTDGDGVLDNDEIAAGSDYTNPCDPQQSSDYTDFDALNSIWAQSDCDFDGIINGQEVNQGTNPYLDERRDSDGDGIADGIESLNGTDPNNPCDPYQGPGYTGFDPTNSIWANSDCDLDGLSNGLEMAGGSDPYQDETVGLDTDGDGVKDESETQLGSDPLDPCDPGQSPGYLGFDPQNTAWSAADCDMDGLTNGEEITAGSDPYLDNRVYPVPEFLPTLSQLQIFEGNLGDLNFQPTVFEYTVRTPLFTDYAHRIRSLSVPQGSYIAYGGEGLLALPNNSILTETIFYWKDERDPSQGRKILETRVLIKLGGSWELGKYVWNEQQTEANLDEGAYVVPVNWIDASGEGKTVDYKIPPKAICTQCHISYGSIQPLGIKATQLNLSYLGYNQMDRLGELGLLLGAPPSEQIGIMPDWADESLTTEERSRAYLDANCAHCHRAGGSYNTAYGDHFYLNYEAPLGSSNIDEYAVAIQDRMNSFIPSYFMPYLGTTVIHDEGVELINEWIATLE